MSPSTLDTQSEPQNGPRAAATRRAQAKIDFFRHLLVYALVIGGLFVINLMTSPNYFWFLWPAAGWGIGILAHAVNTFVFSERFTERMIEHELRRDERPR